jgi:hypothetical protein
MGPHFHHHTRRILPLEEGCKILLRRPRLPFRQRFSLQTQNAVMAPLVAKIHAHRQTVQIVAKLTSLILFSARCCHFFRIQLFFQLWPPIPPALPSYPAAPGPATSSAWMSVHSSFQNCYAFSRSISLAVVIAPSSALITGSLTPSVIGDRPSHPIDGEQPLCGVEIIQIWNPASSLTPRRSRYRIPLYPLVHGYEGEETMNNTKKWL